MSVSIIVPCFNHARTLVRAVASALQQSGVREVIVVDDASTDDGLEVARALAAQDQRVQVFPQQTNRGPSAARNRGVAQAAGQFICFLDADDELIGSFVGNALALFEKTPELIVAKCEVEFFDPIKGYILPADDPRHSSAILSSSCGMVMRREHYLRMGGFSEDPIFRGPAGGEDVAFMQAVMAHFQPIARIEQPGYKVWSQAGSHLDQFLASTRLTDTGSFEFMPDATRQANADTVANAVASYLKQVEQALAC